VLSTRPSHVSALTVGNEFATSVNIRVTRCKVGAEGPSVRKRTLSKVSEGHFGGSGASNGRF
jgi:hypothetical protein